MILLEQLCLAWDSLSTFLSCSKMIDNSRFKKKKKPISFLNIKIMEHKEQLHKMSRHGEEQWINMASDKIFGPRQLR